MWRVRSGQSDRSDQTLCRNSVTICRAGQDRRVMTCRGMRRVRSRQRDRPHAATVQSPDRYLYAMTYGRAKAPRQAPRARRSGRRGYSSAWHVFFARYSRIHCAVNAQLKTWRPFLDVSAAFVIASISLIGIAIHAVNQPRLLVRTCVWRVSMAELSQLNLQRSPDGTRCSI
jgi:hypothetical protein